MNSLKKDKSFIGLDIGKSSIKLIEFNIKNNDIFLKNMLHSNLSFEVIVDEMIINSNELIERITKLIKTYKIKTKNVAISIPGNSVIIKRLSISGATYEDIAKQVEIEAPNNIPYNINDVEIAFHVIDSGEETDERNDVLLIAVKKEILEDYATILIEAGLRPVVADVDFFALQNIFEYNYQDDIDDSECVALINVGANLCNIIVTKKFESLFYRDNNIGNFLYYDRAQNALNLSYEEIERMRLENSNNKHIKTLIDNGNKNILTEIVKGLELFLTSSGEEKIDKIFLSGGAALQKNFKNMLANNFPDTTIDYLDPFKKIIIDENLFDPNYIEYIKPQFSVASGLALRGLNND